MSGDEVLERIQTERIDCRVAMVTAVDPGFDILEMGFDDYLTKPIGYQTLHSVVERLLRIDEYESLYREYSNLKVKRDVLCHGKSPDDVSNHQEYQAIVDRMTELKSEMDTIETEYDIPREQYR